METKAYYDLDDFNEEDANFVLDTTAFNGFKGDNALFKRLEKIVEFLKHPSGIAPNYKEFDNDLLTEVSYLHLLSHHIQNYEDYLTTGKVVDELNVYYRKIAEVVTKLCDLNLGITNASSFIGGVANTICACQNYAIPRTNELLIRNQDKFKDYFDWINCLPEYEPSLSRNSHKKISLADKEILALSLTAACERSTLLFTGDAKHIGKTINKIYDPNANYNPHKKELPTNQYKVYVGFEQGWTLWLENGAQVQTTAKLS